MVLYQADMLVLPICSVIDNVRMPTKLASEKEEDIVQGWIEGVNIRDVLQRLARVVIQDEVL